MIIKNRYDFRKILFHREKVETLLSGGIPTPICVEIDPVDGFCNQSCIDCEFQSSFKNKIRSIDTQVLIPVLKEMKDNCVRGINWVGGGEPTVHSDISLLISTSKSYGLDNGIITNGVLLQKVLPNMLGGDLDFIRISLDAAKRSTYKVVHRRDHFLKVIGNIKESIENGVDPKLLGISFRVMSENVSDIPGAAKLIKDLGLSYIEYKYSYSEKGVSFPEIIINQVNKGMEKATSYQTEDFSVLTTTAMTVEIPVAAETSGCISSPLVGVITAGGDMASCIKFRNYPERHIGNIKDGFMKVWLGEKHKLMLDKMKSMKCTQRCKHNRYDAVLYDCIETGDIPLPIVSDLDINISFV